MRLIITSLILLSLASCTLPWSKTAGLIPGSRATQSAASSGTGVASTGSLLTLNYTLHSDAPDGKVEETTIESVAQANGLYQTGSTYKPFQVALGQNQVIVGFENGLMGMKKGEKKIIKVIPSEGYGRPVVVPKEQIAPEFSITRDKKLFDDTVSQTIEKSKFPAEMQKQVINAKVGETLKGANNAVATITAVNKDTLTLAIANTGNPFYKKSLKVGATASTETADFRITEISGTGVTVMISNKESPFYGKKFAVGESATPKNAGKITITAIDDKTVTILADHKFANKDLYFDVEIVDIQ